MIQKAAAALADVVCIDLEDAVAPSAKEASRANVIRALTELDFGHSVRAYRMNGLDTYFAYRDLLEVAEAVGDRLDLVIVPKVNQPEDVYLVDTLLSQIEEYKGFGRRIGIEALIETAMGCLNADQIASASSRLETIIFGPGDYAASLQMPQDSIGVMDENDALYPGHRWHYAMQRVVVAARAYGKRCVDGAYADITDIEGFKHVCEIARVMGFDGKWVIHPSQIPPANAIFTPPSIQVAWARKVVDEYENVSRQGKGAIAVDGKMVDAASLRMAQHIIERDKLANRSEPAD
jgi:citrate lyase subunit beta/citryl-CoA lyase